MKKSFRDNLRKQPNKVNMSTKLVATPFLDRVLARFGTPIEVLTNQGGEFLGSFVELCTKALIDHRTTSRDRWIGKKSGSNN
jgi:hypothetical protein